MKKNYIIPNQKVALMDAESVLLQNSPDPAPSDIQVYSRNGAPVIDREEDVWAKENNSWDNEW